MVAPFAVDGVVDREKLQELLAVGTEYDVLDYKRTLDLGKKANGKHRLGFVKDVAAFSTLSEGGYLVVGVDGAGLPAHDQPPIVASHFDEATLRSIVMPYIDGRPTLASALHVVEGRDVAVVYIGPSQDGLPPVMKRDGSYKDEDGTLQIQFHRGDIYVREGTTTRRLEHRDWLVVLAPFRSRVRDEISKDTQQVVERLAQLERDRSTTTAQIVIDISMRVDVFEEAVQEAAGGGRVDLVRNALRPARASLSVAWRQSYPANYVDLLDRLAAVGGVAIRTHSHELLNVAVGELYRAYQSALNSADTTYARDGFPRQAAVFWREIAARVMALLAAAVREEQWSMAQLLVLRKIGGGPHSYRSWLRHAVVAASNQNVLVAGPSGEASTGAIIHFGRAVALRVGSLHDDVPEELLALNPDGAPARDEPLMNSLCQADFLWCVLVLAEVGGTEDRYQFYPSCAAFYEERTRPIAHELVSRPAVRSEAIGRDDASLAAAIVSVESAGQSVSRTLWHPWSVLTDEVRTWVMAHLPARPLSSG